MNTFFNLILMLSFVFSLHCMQEEGQKSISEKQAQLIEFHFDHIPNLFVMMENKRPKEFKKIFKLGKPIVREKKGNTITFSQYGYTGSLVDGHKGSPHISFNTESGEITAHYECLERTGINEFAEWQEPMPIDKEAKEEIFQYLEKKYQYESESTDWEVKLLLIK